MSSAVFCFSIEAREMTASPRMVDGEYGDTPRWRYRSSECSSRRMGKRPRALGQPPLSRGRGGNHAPSTHVHVLLHMFSR